MTKEELEKEAEEKYSEVDREFIACQDEGEVFNIGYILGAEPREKRIAELKKEIEELKKTYRKQRNKRIDDLQKKNAELRTRVRELEQQIEKMKSCTNCINNYFLATEEPCCSCTRCYVRTTKKTTDKWEIKEND